MGKGTVGGRVSEVGLSGAPAEHARIRARSRSGGGDATFADLERKEARLRPDQVEELQYLTRKLSHERTDRSERITANTLIRVALDVLIAHSDVLNGNSEGELRAAMTAATRK